VDATSRRDLNANPRRNIFTVNIFMTGDGEKKSVSLGHAALSQNLCELVIKSEGSIGILRRLQIFFYESKR
jgi:hypothetical protein